MFLDFIRYDIVYKNAARNYSNYFQQNGVGLKPTTKGQDQIPAGTRVSIFHIQGPLNSYKQSERYYQMIVIVIEKRRKHNHNHALDPTRLISYRSDLPYMFKMCIQGPLNRYKHSKRYCQLIVNDKLGKYNHNHAVDPTRLISF